MKLIEGYIYHAPGVAAGSASLTRKQWREKAIPWLQKGGFTRHHLGETFVHGPDAHIQIEIYHYVDILLPGQEPNHEETDDVSAE